MQTQAQIVQTLRELQTRESYQGQQQYGAKIIRAANAPEGIARIALDEDFAQSWVVSLAPLTTPGQQGAAAGVSAGAGLSNRALVDAAAIIEWGLGGSTSWALVDWNLGQQFSVYGSFVQVTGIIFTYAANEPTPPLETRFAAHIVPGHSERRPTRTVLYPPIGAGTSVALAIPPCAFRVFGYARLPAALLSYSLVRFQPAVVAGGAFIAERQWGTGDGRAGAADVGFTLPVASNFMGILNAGSADLEAQLVYELGIS
jgi:hypothetical protein